eukprot:171747_1
MMNIDQHKSLKPGSWIRMPIIYEATCKTEQKTAYHHAIMVCPLLEIGFNATGTIIDKIHITSDNVIYDCSKYEIIDEATDYPQCEEIMHRALKYYGKRNYSQAMNNCEHFASYCFNNKSESKQVKHTVWTNTSGLHQWLQQSSWFTNSVLFLNSFDIVSDQTVDAICESNHKIGKMNAKIIDFCDENAEKNKIENEYNIKKLQINDDEKEKEQEEKVDQVEMDVNQLQIVKQAEFVRNVLRSNLNEKGQIDSGKIQYIIDQIKPILFKYF